MMLRIRQSSVARIEAPNTSPKRQRVHPHPHGFRSRPEAMLERAMHSLALRACIHAVRCGAEGRNRRHIIRRSHPLRPLIPRAVFSDESPMTRRSGCRTWTWRASPRSRRRLPRRDGPSDPRPRRVGVAQRSPALRRCPAATGGVRPRSPRGISPECPPGIAEFLGSDRDQLTTAVDPLPAEHLGQADPVLRVPVIAERSGPDPAPSCRHWR